MAVTRVSTDGLADSAVNSAKIGVDVITDADLANNSVTVNEISDNAVTTAKIADLGVTHGKLHSTMDLSTKTVTLPTLANLNTTGNVGVGTTSPGARLHVDTAVAGYAGKFVNDNTATDANGILIQAGTASTEYALNVANTAGSTNFLVVKGNGNVGIGTTTPAASLHVAKATTPAVNTNATETVAVFGVDGNEHGAIRAHATTMNSGLRAALYDTEGGSNHHGYGIHGFHTRFVDIGRADQGNYYDASNGDGRYTGGLAGNPRYQRWFAFSGQILANNTYYPIAYNLNEAKFTIEIFCGDASSRDYKKYGGYYTSPAYGVYGLDQLLQVNGGWNSGTPDLRVSSPNGNLSIDLRFSSYYSSSNVASYKCIFRSFA